ncbi:hypothetical protein XF24_00113 [candidate division SR1 bacterium Aalborg_AAW-1]|nr:hypothetical protein XF24_00113 [candidate division SR1 bacterium Aalborg_AAW-1]
MKKLLTGLAVTLVGLSSFGQGAMIDDAVSWLYNNGYTIFSNTRDYQPNNYMRRDEAAKFFVKVAEGLGKTDYVKTASECSFSDLDDGHADLKDVMVKSCRLGIFQGYEGKFMPTWALTNSQALAVMIRITSGYESETGVSYWADNYYKKAQSLGRLSLLPVLNNKEGLGTRGTVAQLVYHYNIIGHNDESYTFNNEFDMCITIFCYDNLIKKYAVTKETACTYKDDVVIHYPLDINRPNEKTVTRLFYKYNNKLFYQIAVSNHGDMKGGDIRGYFYMYDCNTKKSYDISKDIPNTFLNIGSSFDADDETLRFAEIMQFSKGKIFFQRDLGGLSGKGYFLFDTVKFLFDEIKIEMFSNYDKLFSVVDKVVPNFQNDFNIMIIDNVNKEFVGFVYYLFPGSDLKGKIGLSKIDLIKHTIE